MTDTLTASSVGGKVEGRRGVRELVNEFLNIYLFRTRENTRELTAWARDYKSFKRISVFMSPYMFFKRKGKNNDLVNLLFLCVCTPMNFQGKYWAQNY